MTTKREPLVSVITPARNAEETLVQTLLSVQRQTWVNWELLVVDDGSTDRTGEIVRAFSKHDSRVTYLALSYGLGPGNARLRGVANSRGMYIAFLDADDIWLPRKLEEAIGFMQDSKSHWSHTAYRAILKSGRVGQIIRSHKLEKASQLLGENPIAMSTVVLDQKIIPTVFDFYSLIGQDRQLWLSLLAKGHKALYIDSATTLYRLSSDSLSAKKKEASQVRFRNLRSETSNRARQLWFFFSYAIKAGTKNLYRLVPSNHCEHETKFLDEINREAKSFQSQLFGSRSASHPPQ